MNQEQNNTSVDAATANPPTAVQSLCDENQTAEQTLFEEDREVIKYYVRQLRLMCPTIKKEISDKARIAILIQRTVRLIEMLTLLDRSWMDEIPVLQKACLTYLSTEILSQKARQQVIEAWTGWSDFQFRFARYRGLLSQFLQYHHRIRQELESLLPPAHTGIFPESQQTTEKGGK